MIKQHKWWIPYLFLIPAGIILILFFFIPFFESFILSFKSFRVDLYHPQWVGLQNYIELFNAPIFWKTLLNTFVYLAVAVPILVILPLIVAIAANQKLRGITVFRAMIYIPVIVSLVVAAIAWKWLYSSEGILNYILSLFSIAPVGWLTEIGRAHV